MNPRDAVMIEVDRVSLLPNVPAVYALYGGHGRALHVAYVGVADKLKLRAEQHLVRQSSSVTTGSSAAGLNPEHITELRWWADPSFKKKPALLAAELIAFEVLDPALRSLGKVSKQAEQLSSDTTFHEHMCALFGGPPAGRLWATETAGRPRSDRHARTKTQRSGTTIREKALMPTHEALVATLISRNLRDFRNGG
jgi:hypothetical protein